MTETDLVLPDGRTLRVRDAGAGRLPVLWHHGTPAVGALPEPLFPAAERLGLRWVSWDRPGYGGSTPQRGRTVAAAAGDAAAVADALGLDRFAVMGHSGGGPHALACGTLADRVVGVVAISGLAPYGAAGLDWYAGMATPSAAAMSAAAAGRAAKEAYEAEAELDDPGFTADDRTALLGRWSWLRHTAVPAVAAGPAPLVDDDLAFVAPWGFDPAMITVPVLVLHGTNDRIVPASHGRWLAAHCPGARLHLVTGAGHVSVLDAAEAALDWLAGSGDGRHSAARAAL